jgi:hypothetical protein
MKMLALVTAALLTLGGCEFWGMSDSGLVAHLDNPYAAAPAKMEVVGDTILYATRTGSALGIAMIDVSDPLAPRHRATLTTDIPDTYWPGGAPFAANEGTMYVFDPDLRVFHMPDPSEAISAVPVPGVDLYGVVARGPHVYALAEGTLYSWDVTDPLMPVAGVTVSGLDLGQGGAPILVSTGGWLVAAGWHLYLFDTSTGDPVPAGSVDLHSTNVSDLETNGAFLYAIVRFSEILVVDLSNPGSPAVSAHVELPGEPTGGIARSGDRFFITSQHGVLELDVTTPGVPRVSRRVSDGADDDLASFGGFLYTLGSGLSVAILP